MTKINKFQNSGKLHTGAPVLDPIRYTAGGFPVSEEMIEEERAQRTYPVVQYYKSDKGPTIPLKREEDDKEFKYVTKDDIQTQIKPKKGEHATGIIQSSPLVSVRTPLSTRALSADPLPTTVSGVSVDTSSIQPPQVNIDWKGLRDKLETLDEDNMNWYVSHNPDALSQNWVNQVQAERARLEQAQARGVILGSDAEERFKNWALSKPQTQRAYMSPEDLKRWENLNWRYTKGEQFAKEYLEKVDPETGKSSWEGDLSDPRTVSLKKDLDDLLTDPYGIRQSIVDNYNSDYRISHPEYTGDHFTSLDQIVDYENTLQTLQDEFFNKLQGAKVKDGYFKGKQLKWRAPKYGNYKVDWSKLGYTPSQIRDIETQLNPTVGSLLSRVADDTEFVGDGSGTVERLYKGENQTYDDILKNSPAAKKVLAVSPHVLDELNNIAEQYKKGNLSAIDNYKKNAAKTQLYTGAAALGLGAGGLGTAIMYPINLSMGLDVLENADQLLQGDLKDAQKKEAWKSIGRDAFWLSLGGLGKAGKALQEGKGVLKVADAAGNVSSKTSIILQNPEAIKQLQQTLDAAKASPRNYLLFKTYKGMSMLPSEVGARASATFRMPTHLGKTAGWALQHPMASIAAYDLGNALYKNTHFDKNGMYMDWRGVGRNLGENADHLIFAIPETAPYLRPLFAKKNQSLISSTK